MAIFNNKFDYGKIIRTIINTNKHGICMSYKDKEKQKQAQHESYLRNKDIIAIRNRANKQRLHSINSRFINKYKMFCGCKECGFKQHSIVLDLHHIGDKDIKISESRWHKKLEDMKQEIRKCVVLCANCHRLVHAGVLEI